MSPPTFVLAPCSDEAVDANFVRVVVVAVDDCVVAVHVSHENAALM